MRLARLAALERKKIEDEYKEVLKAIRDYEDILARPERVLAIIKADLEDLKEKYGDERRTEIRAEASGDLSEEDLIPDVDVVVTLTKTGYIKRIPGDTYRTQHRGGRGITGVKPKEEDKVEHILALQHDGLAPLLHRPGQGVPDQSPRTARCLPHRQGHADHPTDQYSAG